MKQLQENSVFFGTAVAIVLAALPASAQTTQINAVQLNPTNGGVNVILSTSTGERPQIFTTKRGNTLIADIINTQLRIPQGNNFSQENPAPGIASVTMTKLDANSVRLTVTGTGAAPSSQQAVRKGQAITLSFLTSGGGTASSSPQAGKPAPRPVAQNRPAPVAPRSNPGDVLVPNPQIEIDGKPAPSQGLGVPVVPAPPLLPRAVPPPVGDITTAQINLSPSVIDLGTAERVPRLVLREAPVREVLALLARAAGLNLAFSSAGQTGPGGQPVAPPPGVPGGPINEGPTISLDVENEAVQDVFNYVLRLSGLEANRSGRTIFVGARLPNSTRDVVARNVRLNQVTVGVALNFLVGLGAESAVSRERLVTSVNAVPVPTGQGAAPNAITQTQTTTEQRIELQRVDFQDSQPVLRGLQATGDERTNSVTLIGNPRVVEIAIAQLTQLDVRRRQVAVNVKVIDVNLANTDFANSSFSFGIVDSFFQIAPGGAGQEGGAFIGINNNPRNLSRRFLANLQTQVTTGNAKILTDPTLVVQEGQTANVQLTQEVVGNLRREVTPGNANQAERETITLEKVNVGLTLNVRVERIDDNGFVSLSVAPLVSAPSTPIDANVVPGAGAQRIQLISQRSLQSGVIRMRDSQTLILSGIIQDSDRTDVSKVPILGDIPILGALFRRTTRVNERREVIVLLTPQVMDDSERSTGGYNYNPSPEVRRSLERRGLEVPAPR